jgi:hypothetical protein
MTNRLLIVVLAAAVLSCAKTQNKSNVKDVVSVNRNPGYADNGPQRELRSIFSIEPVFSIDGRDWTQAIAVERKEETGDRFTAFKAGWPRELILLRPGQSRYLNFSFQTLNHSAVNSYQIVSGISYSLYIGVGIEGFYRGDTVASEIFDFFETSGFDVMAEQHYLSPGASQRFDDLNLEVTTEELRKLLAEAVEVLNNPSRIQNTLNQAGATGSASKIKVLKLELVINVGILEVKSNSGIADRTFTQDHHYKGGRGTINTDTVVMQIDPEAIFYDQTSRTFRLGQAW